MCLREPAEAGAERGCGNFFATRRIQKSVSSVEAGISMAGQIICIEKYTSSVAFLGPQNAPKSLAVHWGSLQRSPRYDPLEIRWKCCILWIAKTGKIQYLWRNLFSTKSAFLTNEKLHFWQQKSLGAYRWYVFIRILIYSATRVSLINLLTY